MKLDPSFRGKIETWMWKQCLEHALCSLGYTPNPVTYLRHNYPYVSGAGVLGEEVPIYLAYNSYVPNICMEIGSKTDLERVPAGELENAINFLNDLAEQKGYRNEQNYFGKEVEGHRVETGSYVLLRDLSRNPVIAIVELKEIHDDYTDFRNKFTRKYDYGDFIRKKWSHIKV